MTSRITDEILDAAKHLPGGSILVVPQVEWDHYERLLAELSERSHFRVSYDCGRLEIVSPSQEHERLTRFIDRLVYAAAAVLKLSVEPRGSATWKSRALEKGVEPDCCYYIGNAERILGKDDMSFESVPPPDISVEIDITNSSRRKLSIYAALGVPEFWHYDGRAPHLYELRAGEYSPILESRALPGVTGPILAEAIETSKTQGQEAAVRALRQRMRTRTGKRPRKS